MVLLQYLFDSDGGFNARCCLDAVVLGERVDAGVVDSDFDPRIRAENTYVLGLLQHQCQLKAWFIGEKGDEEKYSILQRCSINFLLKWAARLTNSQEKIAQ